MICDKPLAAKGLISFRYNNGDWGYIMIGATDVNNALSEANRSLTTKNATIDRLEMWSPITNKYEKAVQT